MQVRSGFPSDNNQNSIFYHWQRHNIHKHVFWIGRIAAFVGGV